MWCIVPKNKDGFTLIELLTAIFILGILAAIVSPYLMRQIDKARYADALVQMDGVRNDVLLYRVESQGFPDDEEHNVPPDSATTNWRDASEMPFGSPMDYEHWGLGGGVCWVGVSWFGKDGQRQSPPHQLDVAGDDLLIEIYRYECEEGVGAID